MPKQTGLWIFYLLLFFSISCDKNNSFPIISGKNLPLAIISDLPAELNESSGLILDSAGNFWSMNDRGGSAKIFGFDERGILTRTLQISGATNVDWEDLTIDDSGNIFISDSGNNDNDRKDLKILKLLMDDLATNASSITPIIITYKYNNQTEFPPERPDHHFDCEALIVSNSIFHLFTKDRSKPFAGLTNHYSLVENDSPRLAIFQSFFQTDEDKDAGAITGAGMSKDGKKLALVSKRKCWIITDFEQGDFFKGTIEDFVFDKNTQIESVCFSDSCTIFLTDEQTNAGGKKLYRANICN